MNFAESDYRYPPTHVGYHTCSVSDREWLRFLSFFIHLGVDGGGLQKSIHHLKTLFTVSNAWVDLRPRRGHAYVIASETAVCKLLSVGACSYLDEGVVSEKLASVSQRSASLKTIGEEPWHQLAIKMAGWSKESRHTYIDCLRVEGVSTH